MISTTLALSLILAILAGGCDLVEEDPQDRHGMSRMDGTTTNLLSGDWTEVSQFNRLVSYAKSYLAANEGVLPLDPYDMFLVTPEERRKTGEILVKGPRTVLFCRVLPLRLNPDVVENHPEPFLFLYRRENGTVLLCHWTLAVSQEGLTESLGAMDVSVAEMLHRYGLPAWEEERTEYLRDHEPKKSLAWDSDARLFVPKGGSVEGSGGGP